MKPRLIPKIRRFASKDTFGNLTPASQKSLNVDILDKYLPEDKDKYDQEEFDLTPRKNAFYYKYEISNASRQGLAGLHKALELFQTMKTIDRLTPELHNFTPLIRACARAGYTKKSFELYEEWLKYGDRPTKCMVTSLINSCAESPFVDEALEKLDWFLGHLKIDHNINLNQIQYQAAIKAYAKLGKLNEAVKLVKEMQQDGILPTTATFNMLLIGCCTNKTSGTTLALRLFKRMRLYGLKPDLVTYRLMLRCIRDCKMGSADLVKETLTELPAMTTLDKKIKYKQLTQPNAPKMSRDFDWAPLLDDLTDSIKNALCVSDTISTNELDKIESTSCGSNVKKYQHIKDSIVKNDLEYSLFAIKPRKSDLPNLLSDEHLELTSRIESINMKRLDTPAGRLMLFGGLHGFLNRMTSDGCKPDEKTFTLILRCCEPLAPIQMEFFRLSQDYGIQRGLVFYDVLFNHVAGNFRSKSRMELTKYFIEKMHLDGLRPNISTFESLSAVCINKEEAQQFLKDVERAGFRASNYMLTRLMQSSLSGWDFKYINFVVDEFQKRNYGVPRKVFDLLEGRLNLVRELLSKNDRGILELHGKPGWFKYEELDDYIEFNRKVGPWLKNATIIVEDHPWKQYEVANMSKRGPSEGGIIEALRSAAPERFNVQSEIDDDESELDVV